MWVKFTLVRFWIILANFQFAIGVSEYTLPNAGAYVLGSSLVSKDVEGVYAEMKKFAVEKLVMKPVN